jgi:hypothetical protein
MTRSFFTSTVLFALLSLFILTSFQANNKTGDFLKKPFDLQKFKKARGQSNSGGAKKMPYYYKPETKGIYYHFFLFDCLCGYIGETPDKDIHLENGLMITTYKPLGNYQDDYFDPTETLIEVVAHFNDNDLPELAFVGLDTIKIKNKLGDPSYRKNNCFIYTKDKNVLVLKITGKRVEWLRWTRLNIFLTAANMPVGLLSDI